MKHFVNISRIDKFELLNGQAMVNRDFNIVNANQAMYQFMGIAKKYDIVDVIHPVDLDDFISVANNLLEGETAKLVLRMRRVDNSFRWMYMHIKKVAASYEAGRVDEFLELEVSDVAAMEHTLQEKTGQHRLMEMILSAEGNAVFTYDHQNDEFAIYRYVDDEPVSVMNDSLEMVRKLFIDSSPKDDKVNEFFDYILSDKPQFKCRLLSNIINGGDFEPVELVALAYYKNGKKSVTAGSLHNTKDGVTYSVATYKGDIRGKILDRQECFDYFVNCVENNPDVEISLVLWQFDNYDSMVKELGQDRAKAVITDSCRYLQDEIGSRGVIGMYDDKTFFIAVRNLLNDINLRAFLESHRSMIAWKIGLMKYQTRLTFSIGVSRYPYNGRDCQKVIKKLEKALWLANEKGHNRYILYREHLHGEIE
ncbi:MAG: diguanylate cyclase domain-containing protein [Lachnospiraceae bacterium]